MLVMPLAEVKRVKSASRHDCGGVKMVVRGYEEVSVVRPRTARTAVGVVAGVAMLAPYALVVTILNEAQSCFSLRWRH